MKPIKLIVSLPFSYWQSRDEQTGAPLQKPSDRLLAAYMTSLMREMRSLGEDLEDCEVSSVFFSGGYMSLFSADEFDEIMACIRRSFTLAKDVQVAGVLFPGSLDMALISAYKNHGVAPFMFEVPSLLARECDRLGLPNALQALDKTVYLMQNFGMGDFGLRLPVGIPERDDGMWRFMLGQIHHYQPRHIQFFSRNGEEIDEHPGFEALKARLATAGFREIAPNFFTVADEPPCFALADGEFAGVGLGAVSVLDGYRTRNTQDMNAYVMGSADYRALIVSAEEV